MDFVLPFQDSENGYTVKGSQESKDNIDGDPNIDGREEVKIYQESYLKTLNNLDKDSILDLKKEKSACVEKLNRTLVFDRCCKSCFCFGCLDSPPTTSKGIDFFKSVPEEFQKQDLKRSISEDSHSKASSDVEKVPAHDPNGVNELYYMKLEKILGGRLKKKMKLDHSLFDGYQHTNTPHPSPKEEKDRVLLAEKELEIVEGWNKILSSSLMKKSLKEITITDFSDNIEDIYTCAINNIKTTKLIKDLEEEGTDELSEVAILCLNVIDLASHENKGKYNPFPIYSFNFRGTWLDTP